jgi:hypothetical protein
MRNPLVVPVAEQIPEAGRNRQPRLPQLDLLQRNRLLDLSAEAQPLPYPLRGLLELSLRRRLVLISPPPVLEPSLSRYQCTPFIR